MERNNILLTGSNGFLGSIIYNNLSLNNNVFTLNRKYSDYNCDLSIDSVFFDKKFDSVIHAAGKAHSVPNLRNERNGFFDINVKGTINLLKGLSNSYLPKQFIFISSVSVYGLIGGLNVTEDSNPCSFDPYGMSKIEAEKIIIDWCNKNNIICTILRLPLVVGANPPGNLGAMINGVKHGYYFNIDGGRVRKSMVLASDVANCILKVANIGGIYNLTDGYHPTFNELSRTISLQLGRKYVPNIPLFYAKILAKIGDLIGDKFPLNSNKLSKIMVPLTFDDFKARKTFGWNPNPVLEGFTIFNTN